MYYPESATSAIISPDTNEDVNEKETTGEPVIAPRTTAMGTKVQVPGGSSTRMETTNTDTDTDTSNVSSKKKNTPTDNNSVEQMPPSLSHDGNVDVPEGVPMGGPPTPPTTTPITRSKL
jgi:hypothetical protein